MDDFDGIHPAAFLLAIVSGLVCWWVGFQIVGAVL